MTTRQVRLEDDVVELLDARIATQGGGSYAAEANQVLRYALTPDPDDQTDAEPEPDGSARPPNASIGRTRSRPLRTRRHTVPIPPNPQAGRSPFLG